MLNKICEFLEYSFGGIGIFFGVIFSLILMWWSLCLMIFSFSFGLELFFTHGPWDALSECWKLGKTILNLN